MWGSEDMNETNGTCHRKAKRLLITLTEAGFHALAKGAPQNGTSVGLTEIDGLLHNLCVRKVSMPFSITGNISDPQIGSLARTFVVVFEKPIDLSSTCEDLRQLDSVEAVEIPAIRFGLSEEAPASLSPISAHPAS